jgi:hypothetical protein
MRAIGVEQVYAVLENTLAQRAARDAALAP